MGEILGRYLEIQMNDALAVNIVNTFQYLLDKNPTSSFCENKLILDDSVEKLTASNAEKENK